MWASVLVLAFILSLVRGSPARAKGTILERRVSALSARDSEIGGTVSNATTWNQTQLLQMAVELENIELGFLNIVLTNYTDNDFVAAGSPVWVRNRLLQMQEHDEAHLELFSALLNQSDAAIPKSCQYPLPEEISAMGVQAALTGLCAVEQFVEAIYLGIIETLLDSGTDSDAELVDLLANTASGEARHQGWVLASTLHEAPWSGPWDTVFSPDSSTTILSGYSASCPASNPKLPAQPWPPISLVGTGLPEYDDPAGLPAQIDYTGIEKQGQTYFNIQSGLGVDVIPIGSNGTFTVPENLQGFSFGYVVSTNSTRYQSR